MVCPDVTPDWVGHLGVTSTHFGLTACSGLWLLANVQVDCVNLNAVLTLDTSMSQLRHVSILSTLFCIQDVSLTKHFCPIHVKLEKDVHVLTSHKLY